MALTDKRIKAIKSTGKLYREADTGGTRGLYIQVTPAGTKIFVLRYKINGRQKYRVIGEYDAISLAEARERAFALKRIIKEEGELPIPERSENETHYGTVNDMISGYVSALKRDGKASWSQVESRCDKHVIPYIGDTLAREVTEEDIRKVLNRIYNKGFRRMADIVRSYLLTAFTWARKHDKGYMQSDGLIYDVNINPIINIERDATANRVDEKYLTWSEIRMLWNAGTDTISLPMKIALQLNLATGGQRPSETLGMSDGEIVDNLWKIPGSRTKNGMPNIIPLTDLAQRLIQQARFIRTSGSKFLFPIRGEPERATEDNTLRQAVVKFTARVNCTPWRPKDLRTTFKTLGGEIGISKEMRDRIQNHALNDVSSIHYDMWDYVPEKREALERWERKLLSVTLPEHCRDQSSAL